jgi:tRNA G37 N-methylase TrmD
MTFAANFLTLYPEMFPGPLGRSIAERALVDVFEPAVEMRAKEGIQWNSD